LFHLRPHCMSLLFAKDLISPTTPGCISTNPYHHVLPAGCVPSAYINLAAKNREVQANTVRKNWKCGYVECSAKRNWHVMTVFNEIVRSIDNVHYGQKVSSSHRVQEALRFQLCVILWYNPLVQTLLWCNEACDVMMCFVCADTHLSH